jgi:hypothetical protein
MSSILHHQVHISSRNIKWKSFSYVSRNCNNLKELKINHVIYPELLDKKAKKLAQGFEKSSDKI